MTARHESMTPQQTAEMLGVPPGSLPRSVAIIMDGNGRWASSRGLPRSQGHEKGAANVRSIVTEADRLGLEALTLYSFSIENWRRPADEVDTLMHIYALYLRQERETIIANNIRLRHLGRREGLPQAVLDELGESLRVSADNTGMFLALALNYGSRTEIVDAVRRIARRVAAGEIAPDDITDATVAGSLDTADVPDPDLVIRTSGELRISNFLLWQISYAELYVTDVYWPDFHVEHFHDTLRDYARRNRRFGDVDPAPA